MAVCRNTRRRPRTLVGSNVRRARAVWCRSVRFDVSLTDAMSGVTGAAAVCRSRFRRVHFQVYLRNLKVTKADIKVGI